MFLDRTEKERTPYSSKLHASINVLDVDASNKIFKVTNLPSLSGVINPVLLIFVVYQLARHDNNNSRGFHSVALQNTRSATWFGSDVGEARSTVRHAVRFEAAGVQPVKRGASMEMHIAQLELLPPNNNEASNYATRRPPPKQTSCRVQLP